jgi:hypothetical protein
VVGPGYGQGTPRYLLSGIGTPPFLRRPHIGSGWHRSTNMVFDCKSNLRRAFCRARGTEDPAALADCAQRGMLVCSRPRSGRGELLKLVMGQRTASQPPLLLDARTHEHACPAAHLVCSMWPESLPDARCSWGPEKELGCPCQSGIVTLHLQALDECIIPRHVH